MVWRIIMVAVGTWSLQKEVGYAISYLRITSFKVLIALSPDPLALLLPTEILQCCTPSPLTKASNPPANSVPLSVLTQLGRPQRQTISSQKNSATLQECLEGIGRASIHLDNGSTATASHTLPSALAGKGPARSIAQACTGTVPLCAARYSSTGCFGGEVF